MGGAGSYDAGLGPAGHDPTEVGVMQTGGVPILGVPKFDPLTKTDPVVDDGSNEEVSAVWQEVAHRIGIPLGAIAATPNVGLNVARIREATASNAQRTVEDVLAVALKPMIDRGDVKIDRVLLALPWRGKWEAWVINLRENDPNARPFGSP